MRCRRGAWGVLATGLVLAIAQPAVGASEIRRVQSVGAYPVGLARPPPLPPREGAVEAAVADAVLRVGRGLLPVDFTPPELPPGSEQEPLGADAHLAQVLGDQPFEYATRFRILEDRGIRRAMLSGHPDAKKEYVVVVEVFVDVARVGDRLRGAGLLEAPAGGDGVQVRLVVEGLRSYAAYAALRQTLLREIGVRSALPVELERGRAVLAIDGDREPEDLLAELLREAPPELRVVPLHSDGDTLSVLVDLTAPPADAAPDTD